MAIKTTFFLIIVLLLTGCASGPSQFIGHPYAGDPAQGFDIPAADKKTLLIFNHGSRAEGYRDYCRPTPWIVPQVIRQLNGKIINGKEIMVYNFCSTPKGEYRGVARQGEPKLMKRVQNIEALVRDFQAAGVPAQQLFLVGHSAGGWASLLAVQRQQVSVNAVIAFGPAFAGKQQTRSSGWQALRDQQAQLLANTPHVDGLVYSFADDPYESSDDLAFLGKISGIRLIAVDESMCRAPHLHRTAFRDCFEQSQSRVIFDFIAAQLSNEQ